MSFASAYFSIYPSDFHMRSWHLQMLDATTVLQTMQKQMGKQITTHKPHMTSYLQKTYTVFPSPFQTT